MKQFDYIIAGGGAAGLTLAYLLTGFEDKQKSILIIEKDSKSTNDRTWCFWQKGQNLLEQLVFKTWANARVATSKWHKTYALAPYSYKMIRAIDFYAFMKENLNVPQVVWVQETVEQISPNGVVKTDSSEYKGRLVFSSIFNLNALQKEASTTLLQHFKGWVIETASDSFLPDTATYMDFSVDQQGDCRFGYVLPFSSQRALVEYTLFSPAMLSDTEYTLGLKSYIKQLGIEGYTIAEEEFGVIPMTDHRFVIKQSENVYNIGINGGFAKASTGYTFMRGQQILQAMVENLKKGKAPDSHLPYQTSRFKAYDATLLRVLAEGKYTGEEIFGSLFRKNGLHTMFKFLDEETGLLEELKIMASTPLLNFGKNFLKQYVD